MDDCLPVDAADATSVVLRDEGWLLRRYSSLGEGIDPTVGSSVLRDFAVYLLFHLGCHALRQCITFGPEPERVLRAVGFPLLLTVLLFRRDLLRYVLLAGLVIYSIKFAVAFPQGGNHTLLELLCLLFLFVWARFHPTDPIPTLTALRWLVVIVLLWSGLQKIYYATYFEGEYLASMTRYANFHAVFSYLVSPDELERTVRAPFQGPHYFSEVIPLVASNLVWIGEIAAAVALATRRLRTLGVLLGIGVLMGIELGARELFFGFLMTMMILLFNERNWIRAMAPLAVVFYLGLLAASLFAPEVFFN